MGTDNRQASDNSEHVQDREYEYNLILKENKLSENDDDFLMYTSREAIRYSLYVVAFILVIVALYSYISSNSKVEDYAKSDIIKEGEAITRVLKAGGPELEAQVVILSPIYLPIERGIVRDQGVLFKRDTEIIDVTYYIARQVRNKLTSSDILVFILGEESKDAIVDDRINIANGLNPDFVVEITVRDANNESDDISKEYGIATLYNKNYYIPWLSNEDFAKMLQESVIDATKVKNYGVHIDEGNGRFIHNMQVPAANIVIGNLGDNNAYSIYYSDEYLDGIATGIADTIVSSFDIIK